MAPKKRRGRMKTTVVTSRKVVEETVSVSVSPVNGEVETETQTQAQTQEDESFEILTPPSTTEEPTPKRTIVIQDKSTPQPEEKVQQQQQKEQEKQQSQQQDQYETQPATEPEEMPKNTPTKMEKPPKKKEQETSQKRKPTQNAKQVCSKTVEATQDKGGEGGKRKRKRAKLGGVSPSEGYRRYVFRVMKQVHPEMGISSKAMNILNNLMGDMFERIASEAATLSKYAGRRTMSSVDIQDSVKLVLPGELGKHAIAEGTKAVTNYVSSVTGEDKSKSKTK